MRFFQAAVLAVAALPVTPALAQDLDPSQVVRGLCEKTGCAEFQILDKTPAGQGADGQLFRTRIATFHADAKGRTSQGEQDGFVFCSTSRPAVINAASGQPATAFLLAPDDPRPAWQLRPSVNFFAIYFAVCHGAEAGRAAARDRRGVAQQFGYHATASENRTVTLAKPEDILAPSARG